MIREGKFPRRALLAVTVTAALSDLGTGHRAWAYPTDNEAFETTGIRRLRWQQDINEKKRRGRRIPPGAQWPQAQIRLRMNEAGRNFEITEATPKDENLQAGLQAILKKWRWRRYYVALLDITDPAHPRYAAVQENKQQTPGSVAKVLVAGGLMKALQKRYPDDIEARRRLLREVEIPADDWAMPNHHEVPVMIGDVTSSKYRSWIRSVRRGDVFTLWEWLDHALSPSSNSAASTVWREATLINLLGDNYPPPQRDAELWKTWDRDAFTEAAFSTVDEPLIESGLGTDDFYIRMFFTRGAGKYIRSGSSRASPLGLLRWMLRVEQGRMIDEFSSLELKRMLYVTRRRIRYASAPGLGQSAVFFKTGSLYGCREEPGFNCGKYRGNVINVLNGIATVETPVENPQEAPTDISPSNGSPDSEAPPSSSETGLPSEANSNESAPATKSLKSVYLVAVMSNELKRNAAGDHQRLATEIHKLVQKK